jgi:RHS repeat-associated protein
MTSAAYDGDGLRASSSTNSGGTQEYTWNSVAPVPELLTDSTNAYIYTGATAPSEQVNLSDGNVTYLITDSLGSVRGTVDSGGNLTGTSNYDAWGNPEGSSGITAITPFGYAGGYTDTTGLIYLINRYYAPATAQFISVDPLLAQTLVPYAYADGDPVNATDPSGESLPPAGGSHDPCGVSQSSCNPSSNPGSNGGVTKYQPKHAKPKKYEPQHAREHKDCHQNEWGWGYCHYSLNEPATQYTIRMLENVIEGDESADEIISMLPDVIGAILDIAGVALTTVKNEMERNDELSEHHGVYFHVYMLTFYVPYWFTVHPNGL